MGGWLYEREAHAPERSPITDAERITTPLFVMHGEHDKDVPFTQIGPFVERAKKSGAPVDFVTFTNEGYGEAAVRRARTAERRGSGAALEGVSALPADVDGAGSLPLV